MRAVRVWCVMLLSERLLLAHVSSLLEFLNEKRNENVLRSNLEQGFRTSNLEQGFRTGI